ncbi:MAG: ATP-binding cassette domain-containing protein [Sutterella seckii]
MVARNISRRFGSFTAVEDTSFSVKKGEIFGLLGPNGAGKTTTFRMLCSTACAHHRRQFATAGADLRRRQLSAARARVGYVSQKFSLYERLTARQNLEYFGEASFGVAGQNLAHRIDALPPPSWGFQTSLERRTAVLPLGAEHGRSAFACALITPTCRASFDEAASKRSLSLPDAPSGGASSGSPKPALPSSLRRTFMEEAESCDRILIQDNGRFL